MHRIRRLGIVFVISLVAVSFLLGAQARTAVAEDEKKADSPRTPMLWVVDTKPRIYLFGTIHVGDPRVLDHPDVVKKALDESKALYTEIKLAEPDMEGMAKRMMLPPGESLDKLLPEDLYERVNKLFESKGTPLQLMNRFKIWVVFMRLQLLDADPETMKGTALDAALYRDAVAQEKTVGGLETVNEQLDIFDTLTTEEQIEMLKQTVDGIEKARVAGVNPLDKLLEIYLRGDPQELLRAMYSEVDPEDELANKLLKKVLDVRNIRMVKRMLAKAEADPTKTHFIAVGAGHMPGKMGIIELFRSTGFRVMRLTTVAELEGAFRVVPKKGVRRAGAGASPVLAPVSRAVPVAPRRRYIRVGPFCIPAPEPCCPCPCPCPCP